ncbi:MAG: 2-amino-4-ketopentanoate thiolase alpha subunit [Thermotogaceae bacterium]|jgi:hypothetical protein|nr:2-amino-4-ketopentanoate thiolase alpha subunit [Thermotogaceae bacterium]MDN5336977.1 2-amino-4-ketopentanoate thiolase alpha subunit [Thermotogaceae bacterium]
MAARKGDWVQIHSTILKPQERSEHLPEDTKNVPFEMRVKGFLVNESAEVGDYVEIETLSGRKIHGKLIEVNPKYRHDFGEPVPELLKIGIELRKILDETER